MLYKSLLFYEAQRSGKLPNDKKIPWRGDSGLKDGQDVGKDLTGGWHDGKQPFLFQIYLHHSISPYKHIGFFTAGDHVKFGLPMAASATMMLFGLEFFKEGYQKAGQYEFGKRQVKWALDYFLKCHVDKDKLYVQVQ